MHWANVLGHTFTLSFTHGSKLECQIKPNLHVFRLGDQTGAPEESRLGGCAEPQIAQETFKLQWM